MSVQLYSHTIWQYSDNIGPYLCSQTPFHNILRTFDYLSTLACCHVEGPWMPHASIDSLFKGRLQLKRVFFVYKIHQLTQHLGMLNKFQHHSIKFN